MLGAVLKDNVLAGYKGALSSKAEEGFMSNEEYPISFSV
jgi:hypothetical protein